MTMEEAKYIIIGTEDGWLKYNKCNYEEAIRLIADKSENLKWENTH